MFHRSAGSFFFELGFGMVAGRHGVNTRGCRSWALGFWGWRMLAGHVSTILKYKNLVNESIV